MNPKVYKNIKKIRELKNFTREFMADKLKMSTSGYGKIERGEVDLTISKLVKIAIVLNVTVEFIYMFDVALLFKNNNSKMH
ncbi:MAG: helix-turn-helix transcriptional regulator [Bacteroidota bacterium]